MLGGILCCSLSFLFIIGVLGAPYIMDKLAEGRVHRQVARRRSRLELIVNDIGWQYMPSASWYIPFNALKSNTLLFQLVEADMYRVTNLMQGDIDGVSAKIFDFQTAYYLDKGKKVKLYSNPKTILLINLSPRRIMRFWISDKSWLDDWLRRQGMIGGLSTKRITIQGADEKILRQMFTPDVLTHYESKEDMGIEGGDRYLVIWHHGKCNTKETLMNLIAEGQYALKHLTVGIYE